MSASPARSLARRAVSRVRERTAFAHEVMDSLLARSSLTDRDRSLATRLTYGTVQTRGTLDDALDRHVKRPSRLDPRVRDALCIAAYELVFADTPSRAAVNEGVELVRELRPQAAGLANAVLRRLAEEAGDFPWGDPASDVEALARLHAHPSWLAERLIADLGREAAEAVMAADNTPAPLYVAHVPFLGSFEDLMASLQAEGAAPEPCPVRGCIRAGEPAAAVASASLREGRAVVCDAAAQLVAQIAAPRPQTTFAEFGAGRGTKTALLQAAASDLGGNAHLLAVELHSYRADLLRERMNALHVPDVTVLAGDATDPASISGMPNPGTADGVLVDAPCSGLGTLRRHPEQRWRLTPADIDSLAELGTRLLLAAANLVKPGGFVVYSTCTITRRENADVVADFLEGNRGFRIDDVTTSVPDIWQRSVARDGAFQSLPEPGGPDGHFAVRLVRDDV